MEYKKGADRKFCRRHRLQFGALPVAEYLILANLKQSASSLSKVQKITLRPKNKIGVSVKTTYSILKSPTLKLLRRRRPKKCHDRCDV